MPLHPQARALLAQIEEAGLPPLNELSPPAARLQATLMNELVGSGPDIALVEDFTIPGAAGEILARRYAPDHPVGTMLWVHGGGWVICDLESHDPMCRLLALESGCEVTAIHYRRAPENPFPAALEDSWDALRWLAERAGQNALAVGGDSAGGNLAAVLAVRARDHGGPELALQVLVYPVTDCDMTTGSYVEHGSGPQTFLTADEMAWFWSHYVADPGERRNPEASPLRYADLSRVAPAVVVTAEYDPLRDEGCAYAGRLREAGVPVTHRHDDDVFHAFFTLVNVLDRGNEAVSWVASEVRAALAPSAMPA